MIIIKKIAQTAFLNRDYLCVLIFLGSFYVLILLEVLKEFFSYIISIFFFFLSHIPGSEGAR